MTIENSKTERTVMQRLGEAGSLEEYCEAARARDRAGMVRLLMQVGLREDRVNSEADVELHKYDGMTVNERLWEAGLGDEFDQTARARQRDAMIRILIQVGLSEEQPARTTDAILAIPKKYGY